MFNMRNETVDQIAEKFGWHKDGASWVGDDTITNIYTKGERVVSVDFYWWGGSEAGYLIGSAQHQEGLSLYRKQEFDFLDTDTAQHALLGLTVLWLAS